MTTHDVQKRIIEPMTATYIPPRHMRYQPELQEKALDSYLRTLEGFDSETLERAWKKVCREHTYSIWPTPAVIYQAAQASQRKPIELSPEAQKQEQARQLTNDYVSRFRRTSVVAKRAKSEGWLSPLMSYVESAAWGQAQLICGVKEIGFDTCLIQNQEEFSSAQEAFAAYRETVRKPVEQKQIKVQVPLFLIKEWKRQSQEPSEDRGRA
jgi:hypothetical protein